MVRVVGRSGPTPPAAAVTAAAAAAADQVVACTTADYAHDTLRRYWSHRGDTSARNVHSSVGEIKLRRNDPVQTKAFSSCILLSYRRCHLLETRA